MFKLLLIVSIVGLISCIIYYVFHESDNTDAKGLYQKQQEINDMREKNKQILLSNWTCPCCGMTNASDETVCSSAAMRFYVQGQLVEKRYDVVTAYSLFFSHDMDGGIENIDI